MCGVKLVYAQELVFVLKHHFEVFAITTFGIAMRGLGELVFADKALTKRNFFKAGYFESLSAFDGFDKHPRLQ